MNILDLCSLTIGVPKNSTDGKEKVMDVSAEEYPEHFKLRQVRHISQALHEFLLEYLPSQGIEIAEWKEDAMGNPRLLVSHKERSLIADYLNIDPTKLEAEKRQMLEYLRTGHKENNN